MNGMKTRTLLTLAAAALLAVSCKPKSPVWEVSSTLEDGVFSWGNDVVKYSVYVQDPLNDGRPTCGISAEVKGSQGEKILLESNSLLGYGASAPAGTSGFYLPDRPCRTAEVLMRSPEQIIIHLGYDSWMVDEAEITLDKQITLTAGSPIMKVIDCWNGPFEKLNVAIGLPSANMYSTLTDEHLMICSFDSCRSALMLMPESDSRPQSVSDHLLLKRAVAPGESLYYYVGVTASNPDQFMEFIESFNY